MDRNQVIAKIKSMLKLQESTDFDGEASAAAAMIDKLCAKHGITLQEAKEVLAVDEQFTSFKKMDVAFTQIVNAVAKFYDAKAYVKTDINGAKTIQVIGSEAQQIQVNLYSEFLIDVMNREADKAYKAEKIIGELIDTKVSRSFKINFKKSFAEQVSDRLREMKKEENRIHEDKQAVVTALSKMRFNSNTKFRGASGAGATAGADVGSNVSLRKQTGGRTTKQLCGV